VAEGIAEARRHAASVRLVPRRSAAAGRKWSETPSPEK
jgi:hypothetical protein